MNPSEPCQVYAALDLHDALQIKELLRQAGIDAHIVGEHLSNSIGELPVDAVGPRVWVHAENEKEARQWINQYENAKREPASENQQWLCTECRETNEGTFDVCWKCSFGFRPNGPKK